MNILFKNPLKSFLFISVISISTVSCANENDDKAKVEAKDTIEDIENPMTLGEQAHKNHCYKCHTDDVYTRKDRFVKSIDALSKQVVRCKDNTGAPWFDEDTEAVVQFLNKKYYRF